MTARPRHSEALAVAQEAAALSGEIVSILSDHSVSGAVMALGLALGAIAHDSGISDIAVLSRLVETSATHELNIRQGGA